MNQEYWRERIIKRSDMTSRITHLTKDTDNEKAFDILWKIIQDKKLIAGDGFVTGNQKVVCFQEIPLESLEENLLYEKDSSNGMRYAPFGLRFNKGTLYQRGARPVIYDNKDELLKMLPESLHWRIVRHDLKSSEDIIDWTHEREWRHPGNLEFEYNQIEIIVEDNTCYKKFVEKCYNENRTDILKEINGIIPLFSVVG